MRRRWLALALAALLLVVGPAAVARADGDPGSDVLVFQNLFVGGDAGLTVGQQAALGNLLTAAARHGFPIRVAIIATKDDLGAITALWGQPRSYARFLGIELSLAYKQRLLVVMPNGFGFNWPGHSSAPGYQLLTRIPVGGGGIGLMAAAQRAVVGLAGAQGIKLSAPAANATGAGGSAPAGTQEPSGAGAVPGSGAGASVSPATGTVPATGEPGLTGTAAPTASGSQTDQTATAIAAGLALIAALVFGVRIALRRPRAARPSLAETPSRLRLRLSALYRRRWVSGLAVVFGVAVAGPVILLAALSGSGVSQERELADNPYLDPGTSISGPAPAFTLSDQFGQPVSLDSYRGRVVLLAFTDSECTTICPMTTTAMLDAKAMLGKAGAHVQLLGVDANPASTSLEDVWSYSELHGMLNQWRFLTGSLAQLRRVWKAYGVEAAIQNGEITHTPALFVIAPGGARAKVYLTQPSYSAVGQFGQLLAQEASDLLPDHPRVRSDLSYAPVPSTSPESSVVLPRAGGGSIRLGPGASPHLYAFFATWDQEITGLAGQLDALNGYASSAAASGLPPLTAVDEGSVEPSADAVESFLAHLPQRLSYPVAIDRTGQVADGYEVQGVPWLVLTSPTGRILWYWEVSTSGWPTRGALARDLKAALAAAPKAAATAGGPAQDLAGSPGPLAELHGQAGELLGADAAFRARLRALRGYPVVVNAWASWCTPCRSEFGLFAAASVQYGRQVAFLGADTDDSAGDARSFLAQHPVSYPSYQTSESGLSPLAVLEGLPTTIYINPAGKVIHVHVGQYDSEGTLDQDISSYALSG
ncbi:MAG TPA: redoxin domain-containing protein [Solirubrobacteraceae bacterium]|nr:redoxin domain-containing protein [Solirubrobacteraceae bacterium]